MTYMWNYASFDDDDTRYLQIVKESELDTWMQTQDEDNLYVQT